MRLDVSGHGENLKLCPYSAQQLMMNSPHFGLANCSVFHGDGSHQGWPQWNPQLIGLWQGPGSIDPDASAAACQGPQASRRTYETNAPAMLLGLLHETPPATPPSEVEAPPSCSGEGWPHACTPPIVVQKNTFLNVPRERSPSLEPFIKERLVRSSPTSGPPTGSQTPESHGMLELPPWLLHSAHEHRGPSQRPFDPGCVAAAAAARLSQEFGCAAQGGSCHDGVRGCIVAVPQTSLAAVGALTQPQVGAMLQPQEFCYATRRVDAHVGQAGCTMAGLQASPTTMGVMAQPHLDDAHNFVGQGRASRPAEVRWAELSESDGEAPELGSAAYPSKGSARHSVSACKPCAFVLQDKEGCRNGVDCQFCHLCEPGEKKRRKKERLLIRREVRRQSHTQRQAFQPGWG